MSTSDCLVNGGIPDGWTPLNLVWLAQSHRRLASEPNGKFDCKRAAWHRRWAALIEDVLEAARVHRH